MLSIHTFPLISPKDMWWFILIYSCSYKFSHSVTRQRSVFNVRRFFINAFFSFCFWFAICQTKYSLTGSLIKYILGCIILIRNTVKTHCRSSIGLELDRSTAQIRYKQLQFIVNSLLIFFLQMKLKTQKTMTV